MFLPSLCSLKSRTGSHAINPCITAMWSEYRKKDHTLSLETCAGIPVPNDIYLALFLILWVTGKGLDKKRRHNGVCGYMLGYYSWSFGVRVRFLCHFPKTGKFQGTPELWMRAHTSPSTGSLVCFYLFFLFHSLFHVCSCVKLLVFTGCPANEELMVRAAENQSVLDRRCGNEHQPGTDSGRGLGCNTRWGMRRGRTSGEKQGEGEWWQSCIMVFSLRNKIS